MGDFDRLILALPPPPMPEEPPPPEAPRAPESAPTVSTPAARTSDDHDRFIRSQPQTAPYLNREHLSRWSTEVGAWFREGDPNAPANRMNYSARDLSLNLTFLAFHQSTNQEEKLRLARQFVDYAQGYFETLRELGRAGNLRHMSAGLLRLSHTAGFFLRDLETSGLAAEENQRLRDRLQSILRDSYSRMDSAIGSDATWSYLQEFARARTMALTPPNSSSPMGDYLTWLRDIRRHLQNAQRRLEETSADTPNRSDWMALVESDLASLPPVPSDPELAREFIRQMTSSFVILIASEIDLTNGDSRETVEGRYNTLAQNLERAFRDPAHRGESFSQILQAIQGPQATHLRALIQDSRVLGELTSFDPTSSRFSGQTLVQIVNSWGQEVLNRIESHSLNWAESFIGNHEQHLGSYGAILEFFRSENGSPSTLAQTLRDFSGVEGVDATLSERAARQISGLQSTTFGIENGLSHFFSLRTIPFVLGTALLSRLTQAGLVAWAGESGSLTLFGARALPIIRGGEFTPFGHFVSGTLVGAELTLGMSGSQLVSDLRASRPEAWSNFGRNFGLGLFVNTLAFGISMGLTSAYRARFANRGALVASGDSAAARPGLIGRFLRRTVIHPIAVQGVLGTVGMIGANGIVRGIHNGLNPNEQVPLVTADETVETFLNMISINLAELPLQRVFLRSQLGRFRQAQLDRATEQLMTRLAPPRSSTLTSEASQIFYERIFNLMALHSLRGVPLETLRTQTFGDYVARRVGLSQPPETTVAPTPSAETPRTGTPPSPPAPPAPAPAPHRPAAEPLPAPTTPGRVITNAQGLSLEVFREISTERHHAIMDPQRVGVLQIQDLTPGNPNGRARVHFRFWHPQNGETEYSAEIPKPRLSELGLRQGGTYRVARVATVARRAVDPAEPIAAPVDTEARPVLLGFPAVQETSLGDIPQITVSTSTSRVLSFPATEAHGPIAMTTTQGIEYGPNADGVGLVITERGILRLIDADGVGSSVDPAAAARIAIVTFNNESRAGVPFLQALERANGAVFGARAQTRGSITCAAACQIVPPESPAEPHTAQFLWAGDTRAMILRRGSDGNLYWIYRTVDQNLGSLAVRTNPQAQPADQGATMIGILHDQANVVTNTLGASGRIVLGQTAQGEVPDPSHPLGIRPAAEFENGVALREGDIVLLGSDGFWENFLHTRYILDLVRNASSPEQMVQVLTQETHARQDVIRRMMAGELESVPSTTSSQRYRFEHGGRTLYIEYIDSQHYGRVYENVNDTVPVDYFKPDNFSLQVYLHRPLSRSSTVPSGATAPSSSGGTSPATPPPPPVFQSEGGETYAIELAPPGLTMSTDGRTIVAQVTGMDAVDPARPDGTHRVTLSGALGTSPTEQREVQVTFLLSPDQIRQMRLRVNSLITLTPEAPLCAPLPSTPTGEPGPVSARPMISVGEPDSGETQIGRAFQQGMEFFLNLRNELAQTRWIQEALRTEPTLFAVFTLTETQGTDSNQAPLLSRGAVAYPQECPDAAPLTPNQVILEISQGRDGPRVRLVGYNRGNLSDETITALMGRFPPADDLTQTIGPDMRQAVQLEERVITLVDLLEAPLQSDTAHRVAISIYWTPEGGFSLNPPSDRSMAPLGVLVRQPLNGGYHLQFQWESGSARVPSDVTPVVTQAMQRLLQRHTRRRP